MNARREFSRAWGVLRSHDPSWIGARLALELQKRSGYEASIYRPRPWRPDEWRERLDSASENVTPEALLGAWREGPGGMWGRVRRDAGWRAAYDETLDDPSRGTLLAAADAILAGRFTLFSHHVVDAGFPPPWQSNPILNVPAPTADEIHWSHVPMRGDSFGDLKFVWELSRCAWAFTLARAYAATGDERYAEGFWRLWIDWIDTNPPHTTVQWKCGQECSFRLIAVSFAVQICATAAATTPTRFVRHLGAVAALSERVRRGGWYAELQDNNHSMSEGAGVYTVGTMYPMLREATAWRDWGWRRLEREAERLVRPDGTFTQKSHNYHRLMLHVYLWATSVARGTGSELSPGSRARLRAAADYLDAVVDSESGEAPNFGANDGALVLPLAEAAYTDFRPTVAAAHYMAHHRRKDLGSPSGETLLWLFGTDARHAPAAVASPAPSLTLEGGGIYTLHQERSWVFSHAEFFRDRPGQADQLHVDLWWRGLNIACDAGTYMYYGPPDLYTWFRGSACHNTVTVDDRDQMEPGPRFLWASRARAQARVETNERKGPTLRMTHDGYQRLVPPAAHERLVSPLGDDTWLVTDDVHSTAPHHYRLHWLLPDFAFRQEADDVLVLDTPQGPFYVQTAAPKRFAIVRTVHRATEGSPAWGWQSRHYGTRTPALSLVLTTDSADARILTLFSPRRPVGALATSGWS